CLPAVLAGLRLRLDERDELGPSGLQGEGPPVGQPQKLCETSLFGLERSTGDPVPAPERSGPEGGEGAEGSAFVRPGCGIAGGVREAGAPFWEPGGKAIGGAERASRCPSRRPTSRPP